MIQKRIQSFMYGLKLPLEAFRLMLKYPTLLVLGLIPTALTTALYIYGFREGQLALKLWFSAKLSAMGWDPNAGIAWIAFLLIQLALLLVGAFTFSTASTLVASPLNDWLAEATESRASPPLPKAPESSFSGKIRLVLIDLLKGIASAVASLIAILLSWIPVLNLIAFTFAALLMTFQYTSYPQTRRNMSLGKGIHFLWSHFFASLGLGITLTIGFAIPFLGGFILPLAVISGTLLCAKAQEPDLK